LNQGSRQKLEICEMIEDIDTAIFACCQKTWRKVAYLVAAVAERQLATPATYEQIADRLKVLVGAGKLEGQGDLSLWRYSEVRLCSDESAPADRPPSATLAEASR
jgi:hypothetical protein